MHTAWQYLRGTPLGELVTGTAHQAHPTDVTTPLGVRFAGQTVMAVHLALEKAATVRVAFAPSGEPRLSGIRNIRQRNSAEFLEVLRSEAAATRARWAFVVLATGWQAVLGQRSARPEPNETATRFARYRLMADNPEVVVPRAQVDRVYTAVDHPTLDKSIVFSVRRREVEDICADVRKAGLEVASLRLAVAAQLEVWLACEGEAGLARDLLLSDGLSALLLNANERDFVPPHGAVEPEQPRQSVQRPGAIEEDIARFLHANSGRSVTFIGPDDLCAGVKKLVPGAELVRPPDHPAHDIHAIALDSRVTHDLNIDAKEVRPALPRRWRRMLLGCGVVAAVLMTLTIVNAVYATRAGLAAYQLERELAAGSEASSVDEGRVARLAADVAEAGALRTWVASNYHAQRFCARLLREVPGNAALDRLSLELHDGQITLTFVVLGDQETQLATHRGFERAIKELHYKIGGEELPIGTAGATRAVQYRLHLIVPDAGDLGSP